MPLPNNPSGPTGKKPTAELVADAETVAVLEPISRRAYAAAAHVSGAAAGRSFDPPEEPAASDRVTASLITWVGAAESAGRTFTVVLDRVAAAEPGTPDPPLVDFVPTADRPVPIDRDDPGPA